MHGDTLVFNAGAFTMDTTAVVEDLLRRLPGVTIWNDGLITVNGKKVEKLLVEGKDFFGPNSKAALQNLSKDAVQKVQVYENRTNANPNNPETHMNIVLKKDKKDGYFGRLSFGYGTRKRVDIGGMISYYSPRTQISLVSAYNNVNKIANELGSLSDLNSFKGDGVNNTYYSDFSKQGLNKYFGSGVRIAHDFRKNTIQALNKETIEGDYFFGERSLIAEVK